jgi:hypothetical protein
MIYLSLLAALFLLFALVATIARSFQGESDLNLGGPHFDQEAISLESGNDDANDALNLEIFLRAFGDDDQRFVDTLGDSRLHRLLAYERKRIALRWIDRKTAEAKGIMRAHVRRVREANDLSVSAEIRLALQYVELLTLFEFLSVSVFIFGPAGLQRRALRTNAMLSAMRHFGQTSVSGAVAL